MAKRLACGEVVPDCDFTATAASEAELLEKTARHAQEAHGVSRITPDLEAQIRAAIKEA